MRKLSTLAFVAALALPLVAHAEGVGSARHIMLRARLHYASAEVGTPEGAQRLLGRIDTLARSLCSTQSDAIPDHHLAARIAECRTQAVARTVVELNEPLVTVAYAERSALPQVAAR
jgi:UrcA family protein